MNSFVGRTLGRYRLLEPIGSGGMTTVFKGYDTAQDRTVAVKVLPPALAQQGQFTQRFRREATVVLQLRHPHIVPVENFGEQDAYTYLVMPYISGGSLADLLRRGPLTFSAGARILGQIASALDYAHGRGVVHRDVKLSNILINEQGDALLSDFGLARIHDASVSLTGSALVGTPAYMSPEQARGDPVDPRTDQYALGVILYQLATGRLPFKAESAMAMVMKQMNEPMPRPRSFNPQVPVAIERVILKATAKNPDYRFASVAEMEAAFQASLAHTLDPRANPAPEIELPLEADSTVAMRDSTLVGLRPWRSWLRRGQVAAALLLLVFALPIGASGLLRLLERASSPAEGSGSFSAELSAGQLTALAGTIEAMSTQLAGREGLFSPDQIRTAVVQTLSAPIPSDGVGPAAMLASGPSPSAPSAGEVEDRVSPAADNPTAAWTGVSGQTTAFTPYTPVTASPTPTRPSAASQTPTSPPASSPSPTHTSSPTATPPPTATPSPTPSATPTPSGDVCTTAELQGFSTSGKNVRWTLNNQGTSSIQITGLSLSWPSSNEELLKAFLGGQLIWDEADDSPPTDLTPDLMGNPAVGPGGSKLLEFRFDVSAAPTGYSLSLTLNGSCQETAGG